MERFFAYCERLYPFVCAVIACVLVLVFKAETFVFFESSKLEMKDVYAAALSLSSILSGFLITFYATIVTKEDGFIGRIRTSTHFLRYLSFVRQAMLIGFSEAILTLPLFVVRPVEKATGAAAYILLAVWVGLTVAAVLAFFRVFQSVFLLLETTTPPRRGAK